MPATALRAKGKARATVEEITTPAIPLGKQLAHTDKKIRDRAFRGLQAFVSRGGGDASTGYIAMEEAEMKKLWKGLFYCFWMSDKPLIQQALAADLAELVLLINPTSSAEGDNAGEEQFQAAVGYLEGFWKCIVREWDGIDRLRIDKFYLLIRRFLNAGFRLLARHGWHGDHIRRVNSAFTGPGGPLSYDDRKVPISLAMHISDIFLEELDKALGLPEVNSQVRHCLSHPLQGVLLNSQRRVRGEATNQQPPCPILPLLSPLISLLLHTPTQSLHNRITTALLTPLLTALSLASSTIDPADQASPEKGKNAPVYAHILLGCSLEDGVAVSPDALKKGFLKFIFREAGQAGVVESSRRKVYKIYREEMPGDEDD